MSHGQNGNEHDVSAHPADLSQTFVFLNIPAGRHTVRLQCRQTDGNFHVASSLLTAVELGD